VSCKGPVKVGAICKGPVKLAWASISIGEVSMRRLSLAAERHCYREYSSFFVLRQEISLCFRCATQIRD
jgi:hypothetical protein